ncbi:unnamed protein product [marine sediment metagenome]|uniref:Laminin G domain-containing protein n=1 Tax=marine sediment metagenome TaxID=412755 RepID=X1MGB3_9ZZZZ
MAGKYEVGFGYILGISDVNNNVIKFYTEGSGGADTLESPLTYNDGNWHHLVGTWDGVTKRLYIDSVEVSSVAYGVNTAFMLSLISGSTPIISSVVNGRRA